MMEEACQVEQVPQKVFQLNLLGFHLTHCQNYQNLLLPIVPEKHQHYPLSRASSHSVLLVLFVSSSSSLLFSLPLVWPCMHQNALSPPSKLLSLQYQIYVQLNPYIESMYIMTSCIPIE